MTPPDLPPEEFYDELAGDYHLIFADWDAAIAWEARIIAGLLRELGVALGSVLDASCGIGTQAIGLAQAGYRVTATDISPTSVERCAREAGTRGLDIASTTFVYDRIRAVCEALLRSISAARAVDLGRSARPRAGTRR